MFDTTGKIAIAQLAFFLVAALPALYCLLKHGINGILGWLFLFIFCTIRIVGSAVIVSDESGNKPVSEAGAIITSVAIAPLIIAVGGVAHESFKSIESYQRLFFGWIPHLLTHIGCGAAIALIVVGFLGFEGADKTPHQMQTGLHEIRAGSFVLVAVWIMLAVILLVSFRYPRGFRGEKQLAIGAAVALVALIIRILYTVLGALINSASYNLRSGGPTAVKVIIDVLPEFLLTLVLLVAGIASRNLKHEVRNTSRHRPDMHDDRSDVPLENMRVSNKP